MESDDDLKKSAQATINSLTPKERKVLKERFNIEIGADATLSEVAKQFDITREKIRDIEKKALEKLKRLGNPDDAT